MIYRRLEMVCFTVIGGRTRERFSGKPITATMRDGLAVNMYRKAYTYIEHVVTFSIGRRRQKQGNKQLHT